MNRILVTGGRDYDDRQLVYHVLDRLLALRFKGAFVSIMHGNASGADRLASDWAVSREMGEERFPADWKTHGKAAGPMRNEAMVATKPDLGVCFPGGRGTADCVRRMHAHGITVVRGYRSERSMGFERHHEEVSP